MEKRRLGRTGHLSTVAICGSFAVSKATQDEADVVMERVIAAGVNHIDISPFYGLAEQRVGPWMPRERARFFLGRKTRERTRADRRSTTPGTAPSTTRSTSLAASTSPRPTT